MRDAVDENSPARRAERTQERLEAAGWQRERGAPRAPVALRAQAEIRKHAPRRLFCFAIPADNPVVS